MRPIALAGLLLLAPSSLPARTATPAELPPITDIAPLVVSGAQPGPGMWKVSNGEHVMWVLGTVSPLPKGMAWISRDVEAALAQAQEVLHAPSLVVGTDGGMWRMVTLAPRLIGVRNNPDGATLGQIVSPEAYARWLPLKEKYIGRGNGIEQRRPLVAAEELYKRAIRAAGLVESGIVQPVFDRAVKRHGLKVTRPTTHLTIKDPKQALAELKRTRLDDLDCFDRTVAGLEAELQTMRERANAWAVGDVEALRVLPYSGQKEACLRALVRASVLQSRTSADLEAQGRALWLEAAEKSLAANAVTVAVLPMPELFKPDGYLAQLEAKGYAIEAP